MRLWNAKQETRCEETTDNQERCSVTFRRSSGCRRTSRHVGYHVSQRVRQRVEEVLGCLGWMKTMGLLRKLRHRGL